MTERDCDVAVIGAGPAGIGTAITAAAAGRRVAVFDEARHPGGQIWRHARRGDLSRSARRWLARFDASGAQLLDGCSVVDAYTAGEGRHCIVAERADEAFTLCAGVVVIATGARERLLPFPGWTLPGVTGVGGVQALLRSGMRVAGRRVVVAGTGPLLLPAAAALTQNGAEVIEVAEQAGTQAVIRFAAGLWNRPRRVLQAALYRAAFGRARYSPGTWVARAVAGAGGAVHEVVLTDGRRTRTVQCDLLCTGDSLVPATELARLLGCALEGDGIAVDDRTRTGVPGVLCAGEVAGIRGVDAALTDGVIAGIVAAGGRPPPHLLRERRRGAAFGRALDTAFTLRPELRDRVADDTIVCRCEDVRLDAVRACTGAREAKLATRAGMGPCQGRVCGPALRFLHGWSPDTVRPPVLPASIATLIHAGEAATAAGGDR